MLQAVIFDHDGTLVNSEESHFKVWQSLLALYGVDLSEEEYTHRYTGVSTYNTAKELLADYRIPLSCDALYETKIQRSDEFFANNKPSLMPFVEACLQSLYEKFPLAVATGSSRGELDFSLERHNLSHYFCSTATSSEAENAKPAPDIYLLACQRLNISPENCIAIEDSLSGLLAAKAAGIPCIFVPSRYTQTHDHTEADYVVSDLKQANALILSLL